MRPTSNPFDINSPDIEPLGKHVPNRVVADSSGFRKSRTYALRDHLKSLLLSLEEWSMISACDRRKLEQELDRGDEESLNTLMRAYAKFVDSRSSLLFAETVRRLAMTVT
jgi:hypothetical protein